MKRADMIAAAKFRATCERCGAKSALRTDWTISIWMKEHEKQHRQQDREDELFGPVRDA